MKDYLNTNEVAELTGLSASKLAKDRMLGTGLPYVAISPRCVRYRRIDIDAYMQSHLVVAGGDAVQRCSGSATSDVAPQATLRARRQS